MRPSPEGLAKNSTVKTPSARVIAATSALKASSRWAAAASTWATACFLASPIWPDSSA